MTVYFNARLRRAARNRAVIFVVALAALAVGLSFGSTPLTAIGGLLVLAACGLFVRELRLTSAAMRPLVDANGQAGRSEVSATLEQLLDLPLVSQAWEAAPEQFAQVRFLEDVPDGSWPKADVPQYIGLEREGKQWTIRLADELFANLDLDADPKRDPLCQVLLADPRIHWASHSNRETYWVSTSVPVSVEEFAAMTVRGLIAHHNDAKARLLDS